MLEFNSDNVTNDDLRRLEALTRLEELHLINCPQITDAGLKHLEGLTRLRALSLNYTAGVTGAGLVHLSRLPKLEFLDLFGTKVTEVDAKRLQELLPDCEIRGIEGVKSNY